MPYFWRLSVFYFLYFGAVGALLPYWTLYLQSIGYSEYQIGLFVALTTLVKIGAPNLWGWLADWSGKPLVVVRVGAFMTAFALMGVFAGTTFAWLAIVMLTANFFSASMLPQIEAFSMRRLGDQRHRYGRIRLWGSIGFIVAVIAAGALVDWRGVAAMLPVVVLIHVSLFVLTLSLRDAPGPATSAPSDTAAADVALWRPGWYTVLFIVCGLLMQASHGPLYTFFTIELTNHGYSRTATGVLWAVGVLCEVGVFLIMDKVFRRFSIMAVLFASFVIASLRWALIAAFGDDVVVLVLVQVLHAVTFGAWHAASMQFIFHHFPGSAHHRGQALYGSLSFGVGTAVGSFVAGVSWTAWGSSATWQLASAAAALAALLSIPLLLAGDRWMVRGAD